MPSLIDRVNSINAPRKHAPQKSYTGGNLWYGGSPVNYDLRSDEYGAAQAVTVVTEVQRAVKFWQQWLSGLTWHIYDGATDESLVSSADRKPPTGNGALWFNAMQRFSRQWKHDFFESIAFSDWVYGETFIGKLRNQVQVADFMWLNPLATEPMILSGKIDYYQYQSDDPNVPYRIAPNLVAFRIAQRNAFDDLRGNSPVITAINDINIVENAKRALTGYYRKGMQLGGVVSGKPASEGAWSVDGQTLDEIKEQMTRNHKGVENFYRWFFSNAPVDVHPFEQVDVSKNYAVIEPLRKQIAHSMGVPPVLSGDPTEVNYDNADKVIKNWWKTDGIPYGKKIAKFTNDELLPTVEPGSDIYFGFDFAPFETEDPDTVSTDFSTGYIPINIAQKKRGYEVDDMLADIYIIEGKPLHRDIIRQMAMQLPPEYAQAAPVLPATLPQPSEPVTDEPTLPVATEEPTLALDTEKHTHSHDIEVETWDYTPDKARRELAAWQRHVKAKHTRPFEPRYTRGDIADMVLMGLPNDPTSALFWTDEHIGAVFDKAFALLPQSLDSLKSAFIAVFDAIATGDDVSATKSLQSIRLDFEGRFADVLRDIRSGNVDNRRRAGDILRQLIRTFGYRAYVQGLQDGGVMDNPSEEDEAEIASLRSAQSTFVSNITRVLINEDGVSDGQAAGKPEMWWNKSIQPFYYAGYQSAQQNAMMEFTGDDGMESCVDCKRLKGQRHRLKDWKRKQMIPQVHTSSYQCGGWKCQHRLTPVAGKAQGKW